MAPTLTFTFANKAELFDFCQWDCVVDLLVEELTTDASCYLVVFCPQPSFLDNKHNLHRLLVVGSHTDEVRQFFDTQTAMLLRNAAKVKFCLIDIPNKSVANIWQKVALLQRCVMGSTTLSSTQLEVIAPCINYSDKHALERIHFLYRAIPVSLLPAVKDVKPLITLERTDSLDVSLLSRSKLDGKIESRVTYLDA
jgi:hypothetical protein